MATAPLNAGAVLAEFRVSAPPPVEPHENRIHEDGLARAYGFKGGLVPGVIVYGWMTHPVVEILGRDWLERGAFAARFARPIYYEEPAVVRARIIEALPDRTTIEVGAHNAAGERCATATMTLARGEHPHAPDPAQYPAAPLPAERPPVSHERLRGMSVLGTPELALGAAEARAFLERVGDPLPLYREPGAPAHPFVYLDQANRALDRNVRVSPWIHAESRGQHLSALRVGERMETRGRIHALTERKGHRFVELDLLLLADGGRPVASIRHLAIYELRPPSS